MLKMFDFKLSNKMEIEVQNTYLKNKQDLLETLFCLHIIQFYSNLRQF